jgi:hypothetical protein
MHLGDFAVGATLHHKFTTRRFSSGAPFALAGTPVVSAYEDDSTTQITAGITLTVDFDTVTGLNHLTVVASSGNGYEAGKTYHLVITTGTVDSVSVVGEVVGSFTMEKTAIFGRVGAPAGASIAADIAAVKVDTAAILVDTGTTLDGRIPAALVGGRMDASVGAMAANVLTAAATAADFATEVNTAPLAILGTPAGASMSADIAAVKVDTAATLADTGTDGVVVAAGSKTGYALSAAGVQAIWDALTAALTTANSIGKLLVDNINATISSRASQASVDTIDDLLDTEMAAVLAAVDTEVAAIKAKTDSLTFTVAGQVDANVQSVNDVALLGDGSATPWGPA